MNKEITRPTQEAWLEDWLRAPGAASPHLRPALRATTMRPSLAQRSDRS